MKRTPLAERVLPDYTRNEEIWNMITHILGGTLGILALVLCPVFLDLKLLRQLRLLLPHPELPLRQHLLLR